jgi:L-alanine-DL-glutamate epimerase-like enolase superfamily enzyme
VYAAGGLYHDEADEDPGEELAGYLDQGFDTVKMKLGGRSFGEDVERLLKTRSVIGPGAGLIVDMTYSLDWDSARAWMPFLREVSVNGLQSPFPVWEWDLMKRFAGMNLVPLIGLEAEVREEVFRHLLAEGALDILQISPTAVGGFTGTLRLLELADRMGRQVTLQCSSSAVGYAACLQIAAAFPEQIRSVECNMIHDSLYSRLPLWTLQPSAGRVTPMDDPGLGIDPEPETPPPSVSL